MNSISLQNVWQTLLGMNLSTDNKRWIADHLYEEIKKEETLQSYTIRELNTRIDKAEEDVAMGRVMSRSEASLRMKNYISKLK